MPFDANPRHNSGVPQSKDKKGSPLCLSTRVEASMQAIGLFWTCGFLATPQVKIHLILHDKKKYFCNHGAMNLSPAKPVIVWHRYNLRLEDNAALAAAVSTGAPVVPLYIYSPESEAPWAPGAASRWWLHHSLKSLESSYLKRGLKLCCLRSKSFSKSIIEIAEHIGAEEIFLDRRFEPAILEADRKLAIEAKNKKLSVHAFNDHLILDFEKVRSKSGGIYQVYTPFKKAVWEEVLSIGQCERESVPTKFFSYTTKKIAQASLEDLQLLPKLDWADDWAKYWKVGETHALISLEKFLKFDVENYSTARDVPSQLGTSRLSPHLHFGELSPKRIVREVLEIGKKDPRWEGAQKYLSEIVWREFAHYLMRYFPHSCEKPLRKEYESFPWNKIDAKKWKAFKRGETGFKIVDAGMKELWATGWMHNRVRMIVASFLVKDLRYPWIEGAKYFWETLVDADLANNSFGWQWSAGSGADAAPYFRIFNPFTQADRYDPENLYINKWLTKESQNRQPILDHTLARNEALIALKSLKSVKK